MDLTTEAIKELKQAFTALPTLPGTERVAAAEVLGLLQSLGPAASMPSVDHLFRLIEQVTKEAAAVAPAAAVAQSAAAAPSAAAAAAAAVWPRDPPNGVLSGPSGVASSVLLPGSPGATSPRAFPARPPLPPPLPASATGSAPPADAEAAPGVPPSKEGAVATAVVAGGRGQTVPPSGGARCVAMGDARLKQAVDAGWGKPPELASSSDDDLLGDAAAAAAAAAVSRKVVRPTAGGVGTADGGMGGDRAGDARHKSGATGKHHRRSIPEAVTGATTGGAEAVGCGGVAKSPRLTPKASPAGMALGPQAGRKLPPVPPPVSSAGRAAPAPPRRAPPAGVARAATAAAAAAALPSLDFRAFLLVVVRLLHELEAPAVTGGGVRDPTTGGRAVGDPQHQAPCRAAAAVADPLEMMSSVFRLLDFAHRGALRAEDFQVVLSGFGGEPVSADQAAAMVELALSTGPGGLDGGRRPLLQPFGAAVGIAEFAGVYDMVQQANQRRADEEAAVAAEAAAAAERDRRRSTSSSGFFKWDHHRHEPHGPPSPDVPNGGSPRDVPPLELAAVRSTGSPRGSTGHIGELAEVLTSGERSTSLSGSTSSRPSSPLSTSARSLSSAIGRLTKKRTGGAQECAEGLV